MNNIFKKAFFAYQRAYWHVAMAAAEINKPISFLPEMLMIFTFIGVNYGTRFTTKEIVVVYLIAFVILFLFGVFIRRIGVLSYNQQMNNSQNTELLEVLTIVKNMEKDIQELKKNGASNNHKRSHKLRTR